MRPLVLTELVRTDMPDVDDTSGECLPHPYVVPKWVAVKHKSIPPRELAVRHGARVQAIDGKVGRVEEFVIDPPSGNITHLGLRGGLVWHRDEVMIPIAEIERIEQRTVHLALDKKGIKALPTLPVHKKWLQTDGPKELAEGRR
jgi:sporulation protein YlmC with PRC-barrel domain